MTFTLDLVLEACRRTMDRLHKPNFDYADKILQSWSEKKVHNTGTMCERLDQEHQKKNSTRKKPSAARATGFTNFQQRDYDFDKLEEIAASKPELSLNRRITCRLPIDSTIRSCGNMTAANIRITGFNVPGSIEIYEQIPRIREMTQELSLPAVIRQAERTDRPGTRGHEDP